MGFMGATVTLSQNGFRGRNDDGSETSATWKAPLNTHWRVEFGTVFRLRFLIERLFAETSGLNHAMALQESYNGGTFQFITVNQTTWITKSRPGTALGYEDQDNVTQQIGSETLAVVNNESMANGPPTGGNTLATGAFFWSEDLVNITQMEPEYALIISGEGLSNGDTLEYRVIYDGVPLTGSYNVLFILVVEAGGLRLTSGGTATIRNTMRISSSTLTTAV